MPVTLSVTDVSAALRKSEGSKKFARYSAGESLFLMVRNGRGYWRVQYRDGERFKAKVLGAAADLSPTKAGHERDAFMVARRNARKGIVVAGGAPMTAAVAGAVSAGATAPEPLSALLSRFMIEHAPQWKSAKTLLEDKTPVQIGARPSGGRGRVGCDHSPQFLQRTVLSAVPKIHLQAGRYPAHSSIRKS
jgi:hypothetical protein